mgnify:CR=1 FL=1
MRAEETVAAILKARGWHIAFAESCTGGLAVARLVGVAGVSDVLAESYVTYAPGSKVALLGVRQETIDTHGVVSEETAAEMAAGAAKRALAEVGVGITGLAGPGGGTDALPVGTVCFGFSVNGTCHTATVRFAHAGRNAVRRRAAVFALRWLAGLLCENVTQ